MPALLYFSAFMSSYVDACNLKREQLLLVFEIDSKRLPQN